MKLTLILRKQNMHWWYKQIWKVKSKRKIVETGVEEMLQKEGVPVVDALEFVKPVDQLIKPTELPNLPGFEVHEQPKPRDRVCHFFSSDTKLLDGEQHAQVLTKTVKRSGLPEHLDEAVKSFNIDQIEDSVKRSILHSHVWDAHQEKLPKIIDKERPCHVFKRQWGIPLHRRISLLLSSLVRTADIYGINKPAIMERTTISNVHGSAPIEKDGDLLQFRVFSPTVVMSKTPLKPILDPIETVQETLPDIYPLKHTLDLKQENIYDLYDYFPIPKTIHHPFLHTFFLHQMFSPEDWNQSQTLGRVIGTCYGFAVAQARLHFGESMTNLPHPITLQCIQTDGKMFDFIVYQLNTLNIDGTDGIKNVVWIDAGHELMSRCENVDGFTYFEGFNAEVVKRFLAIYLNGIDDEISVSKSPTKKENVEP